QTYCGKAVLVELSNRLPHPKFTAIQRTELVVGLREKDKVDTKNTCQRTNSTRQSLSLVRERIYPDVAVYAVTATYVSMCLTIKTNPYVLLILFTNKYPDPKPGISCIFWPHISPT
ncbi:8912_t:CDS:2, partial [Gigaspora margarita]